MFPTIRRAFMARTPHGYHDPRRSPTIWRQAASSPRRSSRRWRRAAAPPRPRSPALAYCPGTPLRNEIEARDPALLDLAVARSTEALAEPLRPGALDGQIQAHVLEVER